MILYKARYKTGNHNFQHLVSIEDCEFNKMSNDNGDRRRVSEHYPTLDTEQLIKPINGVITYFQSVSMNELWNNKFTRLLRLSIKIEGNHSKEIPINLQFDWSEPWLYILICSYIILYTFVYFTRRNSTIQSFTFLLTRKYWYSITVVEYFSINQGQLQSW